MGPFLSPVNHTAPGSAGAAFSERRWGTGLLPEGPPSPPVSAAARVCGTQRRATFLHQHMDLFLSLVSFFSSSLRQLPRPGEEGWQGLSEASRPGRLESAHFRRPEPSGFLQLSRPSPQTVRLPSELQNAVALQPLPFCVPSG